MKLCGVIELFLAIEYACGGLGRLAETISSGSVAAQVRPRLAEDVNLCQKRWRSDRGEMEGIGW